MTPAENHLMDYLIAYNSVYGRLPTMKQLAYDFDVDRSVMSKYLRSLTLQGRLVRVDDPERYRVVTDKWERK